MSPASPLKNSDSQKTTFKIKSSSSTSDNKIPTKKMALTPFKPCKTTSETLTWIKSVTSTCIWKVNKKEIFSSPLSKLEFKASKSLNPPKNKESTLSKGSAGINALLISSLPNLPTLSDSVLRASMHLHLPLEKWSKSLLKIK